MTNYLPNTTQVPNSLLNGEMQKMKDTELRVVLIVTRKTLGWLEDPETGMRKEEDWISQGQLIKLTSRSQKSVTAAIDVCINKGWIEARDKDGNLLDTAEKRGQIGRGGKIFYRLGEMFMGRAQALKGSKNYYPSENEKPSKKSLANYAQHNLHTTKLTVLQNKPLNKNTVEAKASVIKRNVDNSGEKSQPTAIGDLMKNHQLKIPDQANRITHEFQAEALRYWEELGLKGTPTRQFFQHIKLAFKKGKQGRLQTALSYCKDAENIRDREKLFYWRFANEPGTAGAKTHDL